MVYMAKNTGETIVEMSVESDESLLNQLSPKTTLVIGLVGSMMTICTLGFVVLLWLVLR